MSSSTVVQSQAKRGSYAESYSKEGILAALQEYKQKRSAGQKPSFETIGHAHSIPPSTLYDYYMRSQAAIASSPRYSNPSDVTASLVSSTTARGTPRMLSSDVEQQLKTWIDTCGDMLQPPSLDLIRIKAKRLYFATHNIPVTSENELEMASLKWWRGYKKRYPSLSVRRKQPHEFARARATQPEIINHFYDLLKHQLDAHKFEPSQIYAADETGVFGELPLGKGVGDKGAYTHTNFHFFGCTAEFAPCPRISFFYFFHPLGKRLEQVPLAVRGHVSIMHIANANGVSLPPLYVFSGCKLIHNMLEGAPEGTIHTITCDKHAPFFAHV